MDRYSLFRTGLITPLALVLMSCGNKSISEPAPRKPVSSTSNSTPETPAYYFNIFGTDPDDGPGQKYVGACDVQEDHENLTLFNIHSPGFRKGGSKGGSYPPDISFSRSMKMHWKDGLEAGNYQAQSIRLELDFETPHLLVADKFPKLNEIARVKFGGQSVPVFHVEKVTVPGVMPGLKRWKPINPHSSLALLAISMRIYTFVISAGQFLKMIRGPKNSSSKSMKVSTRSHVLRTTSKNTCRSAMAPLSQSWIKERT